MHGPHLAAPRHRLLLIDASSRKEQEPMSTLANKAWDATKELLRELFLEEPSRRSTMIALALASLFLISSLSRLLMGEDSASWLDSAIWGGAFLLAWLSFVVHVQYRALSVLLRLAALLLPILFFGLAIADTL